MDEDNRFKYTPDAPRGCRIIPGRERRDMGAEPKSLPVTVEDNQKMAEAGFDKDLTLSSFFKRACGTCTACLPARVVARDYEFSRGEKRILKRNNDLVVTFNAAANGDEHQPVFRNNFDDRHAERYDALQRLIIRSQFKVKTLMAHPLIRDTVIEVRDPADNNRLLGGLLYDDAGNGLKANYYYYEPGLPAGRSLGTFMILKLIEQARAQNKDYVYLGALTEEPSGVSYKANFQPMEVLRGDKWLPYKPA